MQPGYDLLLVPLSPHVALLNAFFAIGGRFVKITSKIFGIGVIVVAVALFAPAARGATDCHLRSGPYEVENLGSPLAANSQRHQVMLRDAVGDLHLLLFYSVEDFQHYPFQLLDLNLHTRTYRLVDGVNGLPTVNGTAFDPARQKVFVGTSSPGNLMEYDLLTGAVSNIARLAQTGVQFSEFGDDGWLYLGEHLGAGLERYHPGTGVWENFGELVTNSPYAYTLGADTNFAYVCMGQGVWYLSVVDLQTAGVSNYFLEDQDKTRGFVCRAGNGGWFYSRYNYEQPWSNKWYRLAQGKPVEIDYVPRSIISPYYQKGNVILGASYFPEAFGVEVNLDEAYPDSGNGNTAFIRWRSVGATNWDAVVAAHFRIMPVSIKRLTLTGSAFMGLASLYGPVFNYDPASNTLVTLGHTKYSNYDLLVHSPNDVYISGYTSATLRYDPTRPWSSLVPANANPRKIPLAMGNHHYYLARGSDGLIYQGSHHERNSTGGELGWYDPAGETCGSLRTPFVRYDVCDLKPALNGTKMVYSSSSNKLFVIDTASKSVEREIVPLPAIASLDKVVETDPGIVVGVSGTNFFKVDIVTGDILLTATLPAPAFGSITNSDRRLTVGPDGFLWIYLGHSLYRIDPADGAAAKIIDDNGSYSTIFRGGDLFLYGGTDIRRIRNLFFTTPVSMVVEGSGSDGSSAKEIQ